MNDGFPGRSLIENLYATMIGLIWPFLYFNKNTYELFFKDLSWDSLSPIAYAFIFICDDYYIAQRAVGHPALRPAVWRNTFRFWIDLSILICFYGFTLSTFRGNYIAYLILVVYFLAYVWCMLLCQDYQENEYTSGSPQDYYVRHLTRQQQIYCYLLVMFVFSAIIKNFFHYFINQDSFVGFNLKDINIVTVFQVVVDINLMTILWWMLISHWLMRIVVALVYGSEFKIASELLQVLNRIINSSIINKIVNFLLKQVRTRRLLWFAILTIIFSLIAVEYTVISIVMMILLWYLRELVNTEGRSYDAIIAMSAQSQSMDPLAASSAIKFVQSLNKGDQK